jgi:hypothetical protein
LKRPSTFIEFGKCSLLSFPHSNIMSSNFLSVSDLQSIVVEAKKLGNFKNKNDKKALVISSSNPILTHVSLMNKNSKSFNSEQILKQQNDEKNITNTAISFSTGPLCFLSKKFLSETREIRLNILKEASSLIVVLPLEEVDSEWSVKEISEFLKKDVGQAPSDYENGNVLKKNVKIFCSNRAKNVEKLFSGFAVENYENVEVVNKYLDKLINNHMEQIVDGLIVGLKDQLKNVNFIFLKRI